MSAEALVPQLRASAAAQRLGLSAQGAETLARVVDELTPYLARHPERAAALASVLAAIVAAQQRGDPIGLADLLEFELLPALSS